MTKREKREQKIIKENEGLVYHALKHYYYRDDFDDILQEGRIALLYAYRAFDKSKNVSFGAFAVKCIRQKLKGKTYKYETAQKRAFKNVLSLNTPATLHSEEDELIDLVPDGSVNVEIDVLNRIEFEDCIEILPTEQYKIVLRMRYAGYSLREIAEVVGVSHERVRQIILLIEKYLKKNNAI